MRIAVLVYGRIYNAVDHRENILNSIGREHEVDFFLSSDNSPQYQLDAFINSYNPKKYINDKIEHTINLRGYPTQPEVNQENMIRHFINKKRVYDLYVKYKEETGSKYDVIISLRTDIALYTSFEYTTIGNKRIKIPNGNDYGHPGINDQIGYGEEEEMKGYAGLAEDLEELVKEKGTTVHPETLTLRNLVERGVRIERVRLEYSLRK
jgi:hypothetical protein